MVKLLQILLKRQMATLHIVQRVLHLNNLKNIQWGVLKKKLQAIYNQKEKEKLIMKIVMIVDFK